LAAYLYQESQEKGSLYISRKWLILLVVALCVSLFATASSSELYYSGSYWLAQVSVVAFGASAFLVVSSRIISSLVLICAALIGGVLIILVELHHIYVNWGIFSQLKPGADYTTWTFNHLRNMMHMVTAMLISSLIFYFYTASKYQYLLLTFGQIILMSIIVWSASRVHLIVIPVAILTWGFVARYSGNGLRSIAQLLGITVGAIFLVMVSRHDYMFESLYARILHDLGTVIVILDYGLFEPSVEPSADAVSYAMDKVGNGRGFLWMRAIDLWQQAPLFGNGANSFLFKDSYFGSTHPHNAFLLLLVQYGMVGVGIFSIIMFSILTSAYNSLKSINILPFASLVIVFNVTFFSYGLFSGVFYYILPLMFFSMINFIYLAERRLMVSEGFSEDRFS
jgi:hypothetical protein